ncbi:MAG: hypothetical protein AAF184_16760 [Pseudomonadota bacterium]
MSSWRAPRSPSRALLLGILALTLAPSLVVGQTDRQQERVTRYELAAGQLSLRSGNTVGVAIERWMLGGGLRLERLPLDADATAVLHLRGGRLTTIVGAQRVVRSEGDYWTVPRGQAMGVETDDDSAVLEVTFIR